MKFVQEFTSVLFCVMIGTLLNVVGAERCRSRELDCRIPEDCKNQGVGTFRLTLSGKILSSESSCREPLEDTEIRLHLECQDPDSYDVEPVAGWKTGKDGAFEVSLPFDEDARFVRMKLCLTARRGCRQLTVEIPRRNRSGSTSDFENLRKLVSNLVSVPVSVSAREVEGEPEKFLANVNICLREKERKRRSTIWDDKDMNWLKRKVNDEKQEVETTNPGGKRGWSNGIPWLRRNHAAPRTDSEKRLWEGADEEVGWIKRKSASDGQADEDGEKDLNEMEDGQIRNVDNYHPDRMRDKRLPENTGDRKPHQLKLLRSAMGHGSAVWPEKDYIKKYWAESDMSWL